MAGRLPAIDTGALRSSPAPRSASGPPGVRQHHPYRDAVQRRGHGATASPSGRGSVPPMGDTPITPHSQSSLFAGSEMNGFADGGSAGWANGANTSIDPLMPISRSGSGSSEFSLVSSTNTRNMDTDSVEARFPSYSAQPPSWDRMGAPDVATRSELPMHPPAHELEHLISKFHLDAQRELIRDFARMTIDHKLAVLFMGQLRVENHLDNIDANMEAWESRFATIERNTATAWRPSKSQMKLCRTFIRHYLAKPLTSYINIGNLVRKHIRKNAERLRLRIYREDLTVRVTLNQYIDEQCIQLKSAFRKSIFVSCKNKIALLPFARNIINNYHMPVVPEEIPVPVLGTLALLREIAHPLSKKKNTKGADTGFWKAVEDRLEKLYTDFDTKERTTDEKWLKWAREMIQKDAQKFPVRGAELPPMSRDEISATLGLANPETLDEEHGLQEPGADDSEDEDLDIDKVPGDDNDNDSRHGGGDEDYDGDVNLEHMGDVGRSAV